MTHTVTVDRHYHHHRHWLHRIEEGLGTMMDVMLKCRSCDRMRRTHLVYQTYQIISLQGLVASGLTRVLLLYSVGDHPLLLISHQKHYHYVDRAVNTSLPSLL